MKGIGVSPGIAIGTAILIESRPGNIVRIPIRAAELETEVRRFVAACEKTKADLKKMEATVEARLGDDYASIFTAHSMIVDDSAFQQHVFDRIRNEKVNAEWALNEVIEELVRRFENFENDYLRERQEDIRDVGNSILQKLSGLEHRDLSEIDGPIVVIADDLSPSDVVRLERGKIVAFATQAGGRTSHAAIIAKSMGIPAVVGVPHIVENIFNDQMIIVDGYDGVVIINPSHALADEYRNKRERFAAHESELLKNRDLLATTKDGVNIALRANIELPEELEDCRRYGAEGIGLYRSEFLYIRTSPVLPTEEEHFEVYRQIVEAVTPHPAIIRTFDLGGKKLAKDIIGIKEDNPVLGLRGVRLCFNKRPMFKTQLRALLRASAFGRLKIMVPLISGIVEVRQVKALLEEIREELRAEKIAYDPAMPVGIMIEVPSAAMIADLLAREVDFFSIGTNDLIQYALATDRNNENVAYLYSALHPAILRTLQFVVRAAKKAQIPVGMCGEMASDPMNLMILLGLGLDELSMTPQNIPLVKNFVRAVRQRDSRRVLKRVLTMSSADEIGEYLIEKFLGTFPEGFLKAE